MNKLIFKRFHPLAVKGGWVVCDGNLAQHDKTKNIPMVPIDETVYPTRAEALLACGPLNESEES